MTIMGSSASCILTSWREHASDFESGVGDFRGSGRSIERVVNTNSLAGRYNELKIVEPTREHSRHK